MKWQWQSLIFYLTYGILFAFTCNLPFFWDTIQLASVHANWIYQNHLSTFLLPQWMDSGHPPSLGWILALTWTIFGKTIFISHAMMLPFLFMLIYQTERLTRKIFPPSFLFAANALLLLEASLLAQCSLVSPDVILLTFFIYALNATIGMKKIHLALALLVLSLLSLRGMMCCALLFVVNFYQWLNGYTPKKTAKVILIQFLPFVPGAVAGLLFLFYHYSKTGWIGYHPSSPWAEAFQSAGWRGFFFNLFVLGWRLADFGKIFILLVLACCILWSLRKKPHPLQTYPGNWLLFLALAAIGIMGLPLTLYKNLLAHRYLMPLYFCINLLTLYLLIRMFRRARAKLIILLLVIGELSGHFWVYPRGIAMGWDSTLAYLPYLSMRQECIDWLASHRVSDHEVGTGFPNEACYSYTNLVENGPCFQNFDLSKNKYIIYSNVINDFSKAQISELYSHWEAVKFIERGAVVMVIFRRK